MKKFKGLLLFALFFIACVNSNAQINPKIYVDTVINNIQIGSLSGNKNLAFGVKNMVQEIINEQDSFILVGSKDMSDYSIRVELIFFDIVNTNSGFSIFHEDKSTTVIRMKGILYKGNKKIKQEFSEGKSTEISTSTIIIDEGGKFNQESASSAIKKTIITLINNLL
jgi:hypothetical protein